MLIDLLHGDYGCLIHQKYNIADLWKNKQIYLSFEYDFDIFSIHRKRQDLPGAMLKWVHKTICYPFEANYSDGKK
jgi:hypothetical protein